jgi:hypothetical protein
MPESVSLPFCVPVVAFTPAYAAPGIAMNGHPTAYNAYLNQSTTICCSRRFLNGLTTPQMRLPRSKLEHFSCIERHEVSSRFGHPYYRELIKLMLDQGFYVFFIGIDDFYLPGKCWYGIRHMPHTGVICGYDDKDKTYDIATYDINWLFTLIKVPQECFFEGLEYCIENKQYGAITAYKVKEDIVVDLDEKMILFYLNDYINNTVDKYPLDQQGGVEGIAVQDFLALYLDKIKEGFIPAEKMDWRAMRPVWEHKRCMLDRIKAIEKRRGWDTEFSSKYAPLVEDTNRVRMMYAMFHKTQKESLLDKMKNGILTFKSKEEEILKDFIKKMEEEGI